MAPGPGFYACKLSFLFLEHSQAGHRVTDTVWRRMSSRRSLSGICSSRGCLESFCSPKDGGELAEHTGASSEGLFWCCSSISTCVKCRGRELASPFVLTFLLSLVPVSPEPSLVLYPKIQLYSSYPQEFWHIHMFGIFFSSLLPVSPLLAHFFFKKSAIYLFQRCQFWSSHQQLRLSLPYPLYFIIYDTSASPRLSSSNWDHSSELSTPEGLKLKSERPEKRKSKSLSLPLGLSDLIPDASSFSSCVSSVGSCGAGHFTGICHGITDSLGASCLSFGCSVPGEPLPITPERTRPGSRSSGASLASTWSAWRSGC